MNGDVKKVVLFLENEIKSQLRKVFYVPINTTDGNKRAACLQSDTCKSFRR